MRMPQPQDRPPPAYYEAARVEWECPMTDRHTGALILHQVTIHSDGWARWTADDHVYIGYVQAGRCCHPPKVSPL